MKSKKILSRVLIALISIFALIYIGAQMKKIFVSEIETEYTVMDTIEEKKSLNGYIVREETVITAPKSGVYNYFISDGDKLAVGQKIANIYSNSTDLKIQERITELDEKISVLEKSVVDTNYLTTNITKVDEKIYDIFTDMQEAKKHDKYSLIIQNKDEFLVTLNKRQLVVDSVSGFDSQITALKSEKERLTNSLLGIEGYVTCPISGYFSSDVDGYENIFTPDMLDELTVNSFFEMIDSHDKLLTPNTVGKVISDYYWYALCIADKEFAANINQGDNYTLIFTYSLDTRITAVLEKKIAQTDRNEVILVFKTNSVPENFNFLRQQMVELVKNVYTGYKVKKSAVRVIDGVEGVYVLSGNTVKFKRINKIFEDEGYYIVEMKKTTDEDYSKFLSLYDAVIIEGKELYEGKIIE